MVQTLIALADVVGCFGLMAFITAPQLSHIREGKDPTARPKEAAGSNWEPERVEPGYSTGRVGI